MKKIIIFVGVLLLAGCGCGDCAYTTDKETYIKVFEACNQASPGNVHSCQNAAREASNVKVCKRQ